MCYIHDYTLYTYVAKQVTSSGGLGQFVLRIECTLKLNRLAGRKLLIAYVELELIAVLSEIYS